MTYKAGLIDMRQWAICTVYQCHHNALCYASAWFVVTSVYWHGNDEVTANYGYELTYHCLLLSLVTSRCDSPWPPDVGFGYCSYSFT